METAQNSLFIHAAEARLVVKKQSSQSVAHLQLFMQVGLTQCHDAKIRSSNSLQMLA